MDINENSAAVAEHAGQPMWQKIVDFPLVAMALAIAAFIGANALALLLAKLLPPMAPNLAMAAKATLAIGLVALVYHFIIRHLGQPRPDDFRLSGAGKMLGAGLGGGVILFSLIVGIAALFGVYRIVGEGGTQTLLPVLIGIAIVPAFMEELLFRGILFRYLEGFAGSWAALAITSFLFGFGHIYNPNATLFSSFAIAVEAGILLGGLYMLTRSLWAPMGLHAAWNFTQGFIWDVPVSGVDQQGLVEAKLSGPELLSGGAFGLEASLIALVFATIAGAWLVVLAVRQGKLIQPWWVRRRMVAPPSA